MGSSSRGWKDTKAAESPREGWGGSCGVPGRGTPELRARLGAGVWQVRHGLGCRAGGAEEIGVLGQQEGSWFPLPQEKKWVAGCGLSACSLPLSSLSVPPHPVCVCVSSEFSPSALFSPRGCLCCLIPSSLCLSALCAQPVPPLAASALSVLTLCSLSVPLCASLLSPSCPCSLLPLCAHSQLGSLSLCLCSLCASLPSLPTFALCPLCPLHLPLCSPDSLQSLSASSCPGLCLLPLSQIN